MKTLRVALAAVAFAACHADSPTAPGEKLAQTDVFTASITGVAAARNEIIRDGVRWEAVWAEIHRNVSPMPARPAVDFSRDMIVFAALGQTADSCKSVAVVSVVTAGSVIAADVEERRLPQSCSCPAVVVSPVHAVKVRRVDGPASFAVRSVTAGSC